MSEPSEVTKAIYKKLMYKYFKPGTNPNWQAFFSEVPYKDLPTVAKDFYDIRNVPGFMNFLDYLEYLPDGMFRGTTIPEMDLPKNIVEIGASCFENSDLVRCKILGPVKEIPQNCFKGCAELKELYLPETIVKIGSNAFQGCDNVKIFSKKTGRNIRTTQNQLEFLSNHFVEV